MTLMVEPKQKLMTVEDLLAMPDGGTEFELIDGELTERKPMGALSDYVAMRLAMLLGLFCERTKAGYVFGAETTYRCFGNPRTGRRGDLSFVRRGRFPGEQIPEGAIDIPADLIVE